MKVAGATSLALFALLAVPRLDAQAVTFPTLQPAETMLAILSMSRQLIRALPPSRQGSIRGQAG